MPNYTSDAGLLEHLQKQRNTINQYRAEAGADGDDIDGITNDCGNMEAIMDFCPLADEFKTNAFGIKRTLIRGNIGDEVGNLMTAPTFSPPAPLVAAIEKRSRERDGRFKRSKTMTEAAFLALDLDDSTSGGAGEIVIPTLDAFAAVQNYLMSLVVTNRGESDMWDVQIRRRGQETWETIASRTGKSADINVSPTTPGTPERVEVRIQLMKNNQPYGQPSNPVYVTLNP